MHSSHRSRLFRDAVMVTLSGVCFGSPVASAQEAAAKPVAAAQAAASLPRMSYSPYAGRKHPTRVFFGDTHHHTANSGDAATAGNVLSPEQAYRFARGEEVVSSSGVPVKLSRPLDFLVISDHAEGLGVGLEFLKGNPTLLADPTLVRWNQMAKAGGTQALKAKNEIISAQANGTLPAVLQDPKVVGPIMKSVWQQYTATAEQYNEPGRFTALIGYEWTSMPGGNNIHRNVIFRDGKDKADQVLPFSSQHTLRAAHGRADARHPAQRQRLERAHVRAHRLLRAATHPRLRGAPRALGSAAGGRAGEGQQRDAPDSVPQ